MDEDNKPTTTVTQKVMKKRMEGDKRLRKLLLAYVSKGTASDQESEQEDNTHENGYAPAAPEDSELKGGMEDKIPGTTQERDADEQIAIQENNAVISSDVTANTDTDTSSLKNEDDIHGLESFHQNVNDKMVWKSSATELQRPASGTLFINGTQSTSSDKNRKDLGESEQISDEGHINEPTKVIDKKDSYSHASQPLQIVAKNSTGESAKGNNAVMSSDVTASTDKEKRMPKYQNEDDLHGLVPTHRNVNDKMVRKSSATEPQRQTSGNWSINGTPSTFRNSRESGQIYDKEGHTNEPTKGINKKDSYSHSSQLMQTVVKHSTAESAKGNSAKSYTDTHGLFDTQAVKKKQIKEKKTERTLPLHESTPKKFEKTSTLTKEKKSEEANGSQISSRVTQETFSHDEADQTTPSPENPKPSSKKMSDSPKNLEETTSILFDAMPEEIFDEDGRSHATLESVSEIYTPLHKQYKHTLDLQSAPRSCNCLMKNNNVTFPKQADAMGNICEIYSLPSNETKSKLTPHSKALAPCSTRVYKSQCSVGKSNIKEVIIITDSSFSHKTKITIVETGQNTKITPLVENKVLSSSRSNMENVESRKSTPRSMTLASSIDLSGDVKVSTDSSYLDESRDTSVETECITPNTEIFPLIKQFQVKKLAPEMQKDAQNTNIGTREKISTNTYSKAPTYQTFLHNEELEEHQQTCSPCNGIIWLFGGCLTCMTFCFRKAKGIWQNKSDSESGVLSVSVQTNTSTPYCSKDNINCCTHSRNMQPDTKKRGSERKIFSVVIPNMGTDKTIYQIYNFTCTNIKNPLYNLKSCIYPEYYQISNVLYDQKETSQLLTENMKQRERIQSNRDVQATDYLTNYNSVQAKLSYIVYRASTKYMDERKASIQIYLTQPQNIDNEKTKSKNLHRYWNYCSKTVQKVLDCFQLHLLHCSIYDTNQPQAKLDREKDTQILEMEYTKINTETLGGLIEITKMGNKVHNHKTNLFITANTQRTYNSILDKQIKQKCYQHPHRSLKALPLISKDGLRKFLHTLVPLKRDTHEKEKNFHTTKSENLLLKKQEMAKKKLNNDIQARKIYDAQLQLKKAQKEKKRQTNEKINKYLQENERRQTTDTMTQARGAGDTCIVKSCMPSFTTSAEITGHKKERYNEQTNKIWKRVIRKVQIQNNSKQGVFMLSKGDEMFQKEQGSKKKTGEIQIKSTTKCPCKEMKTGCKTKEQQKIERKMSGIVKHLQIDAQKQLAKETKGKWQKKKTTMKNTSTLMPKINNRNL